MSYDGDVFYEAWRRGHNPDAIHPDTVDDYRWNDYTPEEAVSDFYRQREPEPEQEYPPEETQ